MVTDELVFCIIGTMARKLRVQYPGAMYHVMSRGNRRQDIYLDDVDRHQMLAREQPLGLHLRKRHQAIQQ